MSSLREQMKIQRIGVNHQFSREMYFVVLRMSWPLFVLSFALLFVGINVLFSLLYMIEPGSVSNVKDSSFFEIFIFSSQTFSTVGYGYYLPTTTYSHIVATIENMSGILFTAIMTGLTFAKFSRPTSSVVFTTSATVITYDGVPTLMFRIGNGRDSSIVDAKITVVTLRPQKTPEGHTMQRFVDLKLERDHSPFFILTWTVMHKMDEKSPFYGFTEEDFQKNNINLFVSLIGYDETFSETIHSGWLYAADKVRFGKKFADVITTDSKGTRILDFNRFHDYQDV